MKSIVMLLLPSSEVVFSPSTFVLLLKEHFECWISNRVFLHWGVATFT